MFATIDAEVAGDVEPDPAVENGVSSVNPVRRVSDRTKPPAKYSSEPLTLWRKFHIELDSMATPASGEVFSAGGEPGGPELDTRDVAPAGPLPNPSLALAQSHFRRAFIEVVDDLAPWDPANDFVPWRHNLNTDEQFRPLIAPPFRNVTGDGAFWAIPLIGVYEFGDAEDYDGEDRWTSGYTFRGEGSFVALETIRDLAATYPKAVARTTIEERTVAHELAHHFRGFSPHANPVPTPPGPSDEGIMSALTLLKGTDAENQFTDRQLALIRDDNNPCDQS